MVYVYGSRENARERDGTAADLQRLRASRENKKKMSIGRQNARMRIVFSFVHFRCSKYRFETQTYQRLDIHVRQIVLVREIDRIQMHLPGDGVHARLLQVRVLTKQTNTRTLYMQQITSTG